MLRNGALPDAFGQRLRLSKPDVNVNTARIEGSEIFWGKKANMNIRISSKDLNFIHKMNRFFRSES
jgi:hypothetical protein